MIEFYSTFFKSNYKSKIKQLISDLLRLMELEEIEVLQDESKVLDESHKLNLDDKTWIKLNQLYYTLKVKKKSLSPTLSKFINKTESNRTANFKFIDTFSGCGGLSIGLEKSGFRPVLINEIEPRFLETYYFNHNLSMDNYHCGDIKDLANDKTFTDDHSNIDLIVGGPPCQGFSMANRQRLIDDPRNKLYKYFLDLLGNTRPKFFVMENVKGMMNKSTEIIENFNSILGEEYSLGMVLLNAKDFGIPQNRERVFVIGTKLKGVSADQIIDEIKKSENKDSFVLRDALFGLPKLDPKREKNSRGVENDRIGYKFRLEATPCNSYLKELNHGKRFRYIYNHTNRYNNDRDIEIFSVLPQGANSLHESIKHIMPYSSRNHMFKDKYYKLDEEKVSKTITSHMKLDCNMYIHPSQPRGLSPREAARIQTFPDDYAFMGANNIWYAQIGNAVPVKLADIIGSAIMKYLR